MPRKPQCRWAAFPSRGLVDRRVPVGHVRIERVREDGCTWVNVWARPEVHDVLAFKTLPRKRLRDLPDGEHLFEIDVFSQRDAERIYADLWAIAASVNPPPRGGGRRIRRIA